MTSQNTQSLDERETPKPQAGEWTLTAPDGRTWKADSPLKTVGAEQRERVPAKVAIERIFAACDTPEPAGVVEAGTVGVMQFPITARRETMRTAATSAKPADEVKLGGSTLAQIEAALDGAHFLSGPPHERINALVDAYRTPPSGAAVKAEPVLVVSSKQFKRMRAGDEISHIIRKRSNAEVSGAGTASAGLPGYAAGGNGERK